MTSRRDDLKRFQEQADIDALISHATKAGQSPEVIQTIVTILNPVFDALNHGEHPNIALIDRTSLQSHGNAAALVVRAMAGSDRADLREVGTELVGLLDDSDLLVVLLDELSSEVDWRQLSAINALSHMSAVHSRPVLEAMSQNDDPIIKQAAQRALATLGP